MATKKNSKKVAKKVEEVAVAEVQVAEIVEVSEAAPVAEIVEALVEVVEEQAVVESEVQVVEEEPVRATPAEIESECRWVANQLQKLEEQKKRVILKLHKRNLRDTFSYRLVKENIESTTVREVDGTISASTAFTTMQPSVLFTTTYDGEQVLTTSEAITECQVVE